MLKVFIMMTLLLSNALANDIKIQVKGMVCDFCVSTLETAFKKNASVKSVDINLKTKIVTLDLIPGKTLSDKEIKKIVKNQGLLVQTIDQ